MIDIAGNTLILFCGLPRSGKSTAANNQPFPIVCPDSIRLAMHGQAFVSSAEPMVWATAYLMARALFLSGHKFVVVDATNVTPKRRADWTRNLGDLVSEIKVLPILTPKEVCIDRAKESGQDYLIPVIERMAEEMDLSDLADREGKFEEYPYRETDKD